MWKLSAFLVLLLALLVYQVYAVEGLEMPPNAPMWRTETKMNYPGNDIGASFPNVSLMDCRKKCFDDPLCKGIVTDFDGDGPGNCLLKSSFGGVQDDAHFTYKIKSRN